MFFHLISLGSPVKEIHSLPQNSSHGCFPSQSSCEEDCIATNWGCRRAMDVQYISCCHSYFFVAIFTLLERCITSLVTLPPNYLTISSYSCLQISEPVSCALLFLRMFIFLLIASLKLACRRNESSRWKSGKCDPIYNLSVEFQEQRV